MKDLDDYSIGQYLACEGFAIEDCDNFEQRVGYVEYIAALDRHEAFMKAALLALGK